MRIDPLLLFWDEDLLGGERKGEERGGGLDWGLAQAMSQRYRGEGVDVERWDSSCAAQEKTR